MITAIFTSCGRFNLLEKTMMSFFNYADLSIKQTIVIENSLDPNIEKHMENISISINRPFDLMINEENIGQVSSIDRAYSFVNTEYIFHCDRFSKKGSQYCMGLNKLPRYYHTEQLF